MYIVATLFVCCAIALILRLSLESCQSKSSSTGHRFPLPPGPSPRWLVGNLFDIPSQAGWLTFTEWKKRYGDILCVKALGNTIVVLNSIESVTDLLEKKGNIYSDRPEFIMAGELMGGDHTIPIIQYGNTWRTQRKLTQIALGPEAVKKYHLVQERFALMYLQALLERPQDFIAQLRLTAGRIIMAVTYGLPVESPGEDYITEAEKTVKMIGRVIAPGAFMVDLIPILKYIPAWFPFASFQKEGLEGRRRILDFITRPFEHVKREMAAGTALPSFTSHLLSAMAPEGGVIDKDTEETIKWAAGSMYGAGGETTYATILNFILAMALFPEKQQKAQAEIDGLTELRRLPNIQDRRALPYVAALIKETKRWHVTLPLGIAHRSTQNDYYRGYFIPAGSLIIPNVWAITLDEQRHPLPHDFVPERFLDTRGEDVLDPQVYAFGFGRRICPGQYLADNSLFIIISSILSTFNISKKLDVFGHELPLSPEFSKGFVSHPEPFECRIVPRSAKASEIIVNSLADSLSVHHFS